MTNKERSKRRTFQLGVIEIVVEVVVVEVVVVVVVVVGLAIVKGLEEIKVVFNPPELIASILRM